MYRFSSSLIINKITIGCRMSDQPNSFTLRYYKNQQRFKRSKPPKRVKESVGISESRLFAELEGQVTELQEGTLTFGDSCACKVCTRASLAVNAREDHYLTNVEAYSCLFRLLQHLTMIETHEAPKMLGQLLIPMLFFKKQTPNKQLRLHRVEKKKVQVEPASFVVFRSNIRDGQLEYPETIKSLENVWRRIRSNEEASRKMKTQQQRHILNLHYLANQQEEEISNVVHKKFFHREIPSFLLSSNKLRMERPSIKKFIIHQQDKYIRQQEESHKMKQSQPFCIFRYTSTCDGQRVSKYEIFTLETLQMQGKTTKNSTNFKQDDLQLVYIESYTRIKPQELRHYHKLSGKKEPTIEVTYFSEYSSCDKSIQQCSMYCLCKVEIMIKTGKLTQIDPQYLDPHALEDRISGMLGSNEKVLSTQKFQRLVNYRTYKIVNILEYVCRISTKHLKLKWMLNDHDQIVLLQCLRYEIDRHQSVLPPKKRDEHAAHIIDDGLDYLQESLAIEELTTMFRSHQNVNQMILSKIEERKSWRHQTEGAQVVNKLEQRLKDISQSMSLHKPKKIKMLQPLNKKYNSIDVRQSLPSSLISYANEYHLAGVIDGNKVKEKRSKIKGTKMYGSPARVSYKLRPFKRENSPV